MRLPERMLNLAHMTPTLSPRRAGRGSRESPRGSEHSPLQKLTGLVERTKRDAGGGKGFAGALFAVDHGEDQRDLAAGVAHRFHSFERRAASGGDILDDHHALALQALALCQSFDRETRAM